ncbi:hypothetical protein BDA96_01G291000 [Sorghum bicolor]|uniref:Cytochrome P450 n=1 Tax=Sorghum bicolor TaxID=4558 RepID=A0A921S1F9_SORBI|nr:hypothetical protein BDA96_01G291000 [Sorghum bicolor]
MEFAWPLLAALLLPLSFLLLYHAKNGGKASRRLPPGPAAVPVLGNFFWVRLHGIEILRAIRRFHARHGPLLTLRIGSHLEVTVSDRHLAHLALVERGAALADRPASASRDLLGLNSSTISTSSYGPLWRMFRRNFVAEVANPARLRLFAPARAAVLTELTDKLRRRQEGDGTTIVQTFQYAMFRLLVAMCFGERLDERAVRDIADAQRDLLLYSSTKMRVFAFVPAVTRRLFRGRLHAMIAMRQRLKDAYMPLIDARRRRKNNLGVGGAAADRDVVEDEGTQTQTTLPHSYVDTLLEIRLKDYWYTTRLQSRSKTTCIPGWRAGTKRSGLKVLPLVPALRPGTK